MAMFQATLLIAVEHRVVPGVPLHPGSGIKQGDPLPPAFFVIVCSVLVPYPQRIVPNILVPICTDDLLLHTPLPQQYSLSTLTKFIVKVKQHAKYLGIQLGNVSPEEACALSMARATFRAGFMCSIPVTFSQRITGLRGAPRCSP